MQTVTNISGRGAGIRGGSSGSTRKPTAAVGERPGGRARTDVLRVGQQLDLAPVDQPQQLVADVARTLHAAHLQAEAGRAAGQRRAGGGCSGVGSY